MPKGMRPGTKIKRYGVALAVPAALLGLIFVWAQPKIKGFLEADDCSDRGGSFNYELCACDLTANHSYREDHQCW